MKKATLAPSLAIVTTLLLSACGPTTSESPTLEAQIHQYEKDQLNSERDYPFTPRSFPMGLIKIAVADSGIPDPNNSGIRGVLARRNGPGDEDFDFCGTVYRTNSVGYIDHVQTFYGTMTKGDPKVTALGASATALCNTRVVQKPSQSATRSLFDEKPAAK